MAASFLLALALAVQDSGELRGARTAARATATILPGERIDFGDFERTETEFGAEFHPARYRQPHSAGDDRENEFRLIEFH